MNHGLRWPGMRLVLALVIAVTAMAGAFVPAPRDVAAGSGTTTDYLNLRTGPGTWYDVITVMPPGASLWIGGDRAGSGFHRVIYQGIDAWAASAYLSWGGGGSSDWSSSDTGWATTTSDLNLRAGPSTGEAVILVMPPGAGLTLTGQQSNGFLSVEYNGTAGWAYSEWISTGGGSTDGGSTSSGTGPATVTSDLNLRSGPSTGDSVILVMPPGASITLTGQASNGFLSLEYNGTSGWGHSDWISTGGGGSTNDYEPDGDPTYGGGNADPDEMIRIIYDAADRYGQPREDMLRVARCESGLNPDAVNPAGSYGLFQFIPSTWATTPYAEYDIFDPWANANAAAWMWSVGRRNEWVCQ